MNNIRIINEKDLNIKLKDLKFTFRYDLALLHQLESFLIKEISEYNRERDKNAYVLI